MLKKLREANIQRDKEWAGGLQLSLSFRGNELAGEVGEACNILKKLDREILGIRGSRSDDWQLADELADIIICVDLIAMQRKIDLENAIVRKFNKTSYDNQLLTRLEKDDNQ